MASRLLVIAPDYLVFGRYTMGLVDSRTSQMERVTL